MKDILDNVADVGGAMFTASYIRSTVVDFSLPLVEAINTFFLKNPKVKKRCCYIKVNKIKH